MINDIFLMTQFLRQKISNEKKQIIVWGLAGKVQGEDICPRGWELLKKLGKGEHTHLQYGGSFWGSFFAVSRRKSTKSRGKELWRQKLTHTTTKLESLQLWVSTVWKGQEKNSRKSFFFQFGESNFKCTIFCPYPLN